MAACRWFRRGLVGERCLATLPNPASAVNSPLDTPLLLQTINTANTMTHSRRSLLKISLLGAPGLAFGGALQDGEPTLPNFDLLERVIAILRNHKDDRLRPHTYDEKGRKFSYYLNQLAFIGRSQTVAGPRNIVFCGYTRSAAYTDGVTGPAHGHRFILCLTDSMELEFFGRTDAWQHEVFLAGTVLTIEQKKLDLNTHPAFAHFREFRPL
jgi:hypothetical protein